MPFDPRAFVAGAQPTQMPMTAPTEDPAPMSATAGATQAPSGFDPQRFINGGQATDQLTGEKIPLTFSGNSPETAMNKNTLDASDKFRLSVGNQSGNIAYLKSKFSEAQVVQEPGKIFGKNDEIVYRDGNTWYRVDPTTGDAPDAWTKAKEFVRDQTSLKEIMAAAPTAIGIGAAALSAAATEGLSIPESAAIAGGVSGAVRTSLGRIVGTYNASPAEQAWDIAFESLLNAGGAKIATGGKPTANWVSGKLGAISEMFKDTVEPMLPEFMKKAGNLASDAGTALMNTPQAAFKKLFASYSVGENNFDTMVEQPNLVSSTMKRISGMTGSDVQGYHDQAIREQVGEIGKIAGDARSTLTQIYGQMRNKLLSKVPGNFSTNLEDSVYSAYKDALQKGIATLQVGGKSLMGADAIDYLAKNGSSKASFNLLSQDELKIALQRGAKLDEGIGYLAADKEAYGTLKEFYDHLGAFAGGVDRTGPEGAKDLLDFKKVATDLANKAVNSDTLQGSYDVRQVINNAKSAVDDNVFQALKKHGADGDFLSLNSTYDQLATQFAPLLQAQKRAIAAGENKPYEGLLSTFLARPKASASARFAIDDAVSAAKSSGLDALATKLAVQKNNIQVLEAAKAFNPIKPGVLKADSLGAGQAALTAYSVTHPMYGAAVLGMTALRSPTVARGAIGMQQATLQGLMKGQEMLSSMSKSQLDKFMSDPNAIAQLTSGVVSAPLIRAKATQAMQAAVQQAAQRPQQGQQQMQSGDAGL